MSKKDAYSTSFKNIGFHIWFHKIYLKMQVVFNPPTHSIKNLNFFDCFLKCYKIKRLKTRYEDFNKRLYSSPFTKVISLNKSKRGPWLLRPVNTIDVTSKMWQTRKTLESNRKHNLGILNQRWQNMSLTVRLLLWENFISIHFWKTWDNF